MLQDDFGLFIGDTFALSAAPSALLDARAKEVLRALRLTALEIAREMPAEAIGEDVWTVLAQLRRLGGASG